MVVVKFTQSITPSGLFCQRQSISISIETAFRKWVCFFCGVLLHPIGVTSFLLALLSLFAAQRVYPFGD